MKITAVITIILSLVLLTANFAAAASVDSVDILIKALVDRQIITEDDASAVRAEIATIRQDEEANKKSYSVTGKQPIKLSGYVQERYVQSTQPGVNSSLEARRVRLTLSGDATPTVDYKVQLEFAGSRKGLTDSSIKNGALSSKTGSFGKPLLVDGVIGYKVFGGNKLSVGQFKIPFGLENLTSSYNLDTINRTQVTETLVPGRDNGSQGRDIGVQFGGTKQLNEEGSKQLEYQLAFFNGAGINVGDDNGRKDVAGRVLWKPGIDGLSIGAAHYNGSAGAARLAHVRTGGEAVFIRGPWTVKSEYVWAKDASINKKGWYATLVRQLNSNTQAVVRYDNLDPNTSADNDRASTWTYGLNRFLNKDGSTRIQLNYERHLEQGTQKPNDLILAQFQAGY
ncbi:MAG TPA: porin [Armatimonadota bacterium]